MFQNRFTHFPALMPRVTASAPTPATILSGLVLEMDPRRVTLNGSAITAFTNTPNPTGLITQSNASNQATLSASDAQFNNEPVALFTGSNAATAKFYVLPNLASLTQGEVFVVMRQNYSYPGPPTPATPTLMGIWTLGTGAGTLYPNTPGRIFDGAGSNTRFDYGASSINVNVTHIYNVRVQSNSYIAYQSMAPGSGIIYTNTGSVTVGFPTAPRFGANSTASAPFNGRLAYLCICNQVQTSGARAAMIAYLKERFAIS